MHSSWLPTRCMSTNWRIESSDLRWGRPDQHRGAAQGAARALLWRQSPCISHSSCRWTAHPLPAHGMRCTTTEAQHAADGLAPVGAAEQLGTLQRRAGCMKPAAGDPAAGDRQVKRMGCCSWPSLMCTGTSARCAPGRPAGRPCLTAQEPMPPAELTPAEQLWGAGCSRRYPAFTGPPNKCRDRDRAQSPGDRPC